MAEDVAMQHRLKVGNYAAQEADRSDESDGSDQVNKEKNLSFLSHQSAPIAATAANAGQESSSYLHFSERNISEASNKKELSSAAKIVENFENRKLNDDVIYRDNDSAENTDARSIYEQRVRRSMFQTQEALQDSMLGLKEAMEAITKSEGKKIERVLSLETKGLFLFYHFYFTCISNV